MKKYVLKAMPAAALILCAVSLLVSCASTAGARKTTPEMIDYKDKKFGKKVPDWVTMEVRELEARKENADVYVFKFISPRGKSLEGVRSITQSLDMPQQVAQMAGVRMKQKAAATATDNLDAVGRWRMFPFPASGRKRNSGRRIAILTKMAMSRKNPLPIMHCTLFLRVLWIRSLRRR